MRVLKKPPSTSPYLVIKRGGSGKSCQTYVVSGSVSILEASSVSNGIAALVGAYYLFDFEYPMEAKGAYLFLQEYLLNDFITNRPSKYAAALVKYQTAAMQMTAS